jgi:hypothetical protein
MAPLPQDAWWATIRAGVLAMRHQPSLAACTDLELRAIENSAYGVCRAVRQERARRRTVLDLRQLQLPL